MPPPPVTADTAVPTPPADSAAAPAAKSPPSYAPPGDRPLRSELGGLLSAVRSRLRRYVLLRGLAVLVLTAIGVFWAALWLDDLWFFVTRLELPEWFRIGFDGAAAMLLLGVAAVWVVGRLVVSATPRDLALAAERRFPDLRGRLVLAVERSENPALAREESPFTAALADQAAAGAAERVRSLPPGELFDPAPLRRTAALAGVLLAGTVAFGFWQTGTVQRLSDAYLELAEVYRVRTTSLTVATLLPPGDEVKLLVPGEPHRHPRGADLVLLISTPDGERPGGGPWRTPEKVTVTRETDRGSTGSSWALRDGPGKFRFALDEVRDGMTIWLSGGDFVTRVPYRIDAVEPPRPRSVTLSAVYPAYTGRNATGADGESLPEIRPVRGAKATVPVGTQFELVFGGEQAARRRPRDDRRRRRPDRDGIRRGGDRRSRPPHHAPAGADRSGGRGRGAVRRRRGHRRRASGARVTVELEDADGIRSQAPVRLVLAGVTDDPPAVRAEPTGVSDALTRTATVPFVGMIEDDYGVSRSGSSTNSRTNAASPWATATPPESGGNAASACGPAACRSDSKSATPTRTPASTASPNGSWSPGSIRSWVRR